MLFRVKIWRALIILSHQDIGSLLSLVRISKGFVEEVFLSLLKAVYFEELEGIYGYGSFLSRG